MVKAVSLFCGCGGADLGLTGGFTYLGEEYDRTGVNIIHASDFNQKAVNTYNLNFAHKAQCIDIKDLSLEGLKTDILIGGFPCQSFSTVNPTKTPENKDSQLFWSMAIIAEQLKPKVLIAENVKGFYRLKKGKYFELAKQRFEEIGYTVSHKLLNASDFGVPQLRERLFMVGVRRDLKTEFVFPSSTHGPESPGNTKKVVLDSIVKSLVPEDSKYYFSKRAVEGVKRAKTNMKRALAQSLDRQCLTITSHLAKVSLNSRDPVLLVDASKELYRRFTPVEAAGIQSFPVDFRFSGSEADAYRQIGNAVPPVIMWYLTKAIIEQIFDVESIDKSRPCTNVQVARSTASRCLVEYCR